ncbi:hypothetical protein ACHAWF_008199 [Thalassiosira exigua]
MLGSAVRPPLAAAPPAGTAAAGAVEPDPSDRRRRRRRGRSEGASAAGREEGGGRERVLPLIRRPAHLRGDVAPFAVGYLLLAIADVRVRRLADDEGGVGSGLDAWGDRLPALAAAVVDFLYLLLLLSQLALFLKCQWDPLWRAKVGYYRYESAAAAAGGAERKLRDMRTWTHCLVIPPNPGDVSDSGGKDGGGGAGGSGKGGGKRRGEGGGKADDRASRTVRPERPGIVPVSLEEGGSSVVATAQFRGWTYRCCCNAGGGSGGDDDEDDDDDDNGTHADIAMESIWILDEGEPALEEIEFDEDEGRETEPSDEGIGSTGQTISVKRPTTWEPRFHRPRCPTDLPLDFYSLWTGHSPSTHAVTRSIFGENCTAIPLPPYLSLLAEQLLQPMFLFQLFCVALWCLDEYWMYALFTLGSLLMFEAVQAANRYKSVKRLREEVTGGDGDGADGGGNDARRRRVECYRSGEWRTLPASQLVVGDVVSLVSPSIHDGNNRLRNKSAVVRGVHDHERGATVPADLLILSGRAVANEAALTGESVPQVKESIDSDEGTEGTLDLSDGSAHSRCVLFGGTVLMDHHSAAEREGGEGDGGGGVTGAGVPPPPDGGLTCFVLRTGFDTVQGQLLRTLAYHAEAGGGASGGGEGVDARETFYFLLLLLVCALVSAMTVVQHAWGDVTRNRFKLALHVVVIVTSVIPPELPMELSLAVTTSLAELAKRYGIHCTEPFRIPLAGLVDTCCFDKTGTLTSDELRLHGVLLPGASSGSGRKKGGEDVERGKGSDAALDEDLILFDDVLSREADEAGEANQHKRIRSLIPQDTLRVMVGCQSLATTHVLAPDRRTGRTTVQTELCGDPLEKTVVEGCGYAVHPRTEAVVPRESLDAGGGGREAGEGSTSPSIRVLHRFAFSSKLRRMTVLAVDSPGGDSDISDNNDRLRALTKGAPEALRPLLDPASVPPDYEASYLRHMTLGRRVLALAHQDLGRNVPSNVHKRKSSPRDAVERRLTFAGLLVMDSPLKSDSARVVRELRVGGQDVVMVTGDAVLTAAEVARRVGIIDAPESRTYELLCDESGHGRNGSSAGKGRQEAFFFRPLDRSLEEEGEGEETGLLPYTASNAPKLESLMREGKANFCVAGDVLAKLAASAVWTSMDSSSLAAVDDRAVLRHPAAASALSRLVPLVSVFARHAPRHKEAVVTALNAAGRHTLMCGDGTNDVGALKAAHVGVSIVSVPDLEAKQRSADDAIGAARAEEKRERKRSKKRGDPSKGEKGSGSSAAKGRKTKRERGDRSERIERSLRALAEAEDELNYVSLGNASVASPFTSRKTSVRCCKDVLQQGRCTLVTMTTIYKILGVQCLVNAMVLTKLHRKGVKQGDRQLTAVSLAVALLFLFVTRGKPLPRLSSRRPPSSVLCAATLLSIAAQFGIHFLAISAAALASEAYADPYDPSAVPDGPFHPNVLNTSAFLVTVLSSVNAFLVNYRGRPYVEDLRENKLLYRSIQGCYFVLFVCAVEAFPPLNQLMQLSPLPTSGPPAIFDDVRDGHRYSGMLIHDFLLQVVSLVGFRTMLCIIMVLDTVAVMLSENAIRSLLEG